MPGVCLTTTTETGTCATEDMDSTSPTFGAIQDCYTTTAQTGTEYKEVISVYLRQPIAVCGNGVCETGENDASSPGSCPNDCHPGTWAKDYSPNLGTSSLNVNTSASSGSSFGSIGMSAVAPDGSIAVAGMVQTTVDLGGVLLSAAQGSGVLAMYNPDGTFAWQAQFGNTSTSAPGGQLQQVNGIAVAPSGNITVVGRAATPDANDPTVSIAAIWVSTYSSAGALVGTFSLPVVPTKPNTSLGVLNLSQALGVDSQGNLVLSGSFQGTATFGATRLQSDADLNDTFVVKVTPAGGVLWAQSINSAGVPYALALDPADNIVVTTHLDSGGNPLAQLYKLCPDGTAGNCPDGSTGWIKALPNSENGSGPTGSFSVATFDATGNVYATGYFGSGQDFGAGPITVSGLVPFIAKYDTNGSFQWVQYPSLSCEGAPNCDLSSSGTTEGVAIGFDPIGNVIFGSIGDPIVGGAIDFGAGPFLTYSANNIFLAAYSPQGQFQWAKQIPTILGSDLLSMAIDSQGRVVAGGVYSGSMQLDDTLLVTPVPQNPGVVDAFLGSFGGPSTTDKTPPVIGAGSDETGSPLFTVPENIYTQATSQCGTDVFFMPPTAIDTGNPIANAPPAGVSVACSPPPNTIFPINTPANPSTLVTCTATDPLGNHSSATFTVTVVDTVPPVIELPAPAPTQATGPGGAVVTYPSPTAIDQVDCSSPASSDRSCTATSSACITPACTPASGSTFPIGKTPVTCTATDAHGNASSASFTVTVADAPPSISVTAPASTGATSKAGAVVTYSASATDLVDGTNPVTCSPSSGSTFPIGSTPVTCTATNSSNLSASASFTVDVIDTTPPVLTVPGSPLKVAATSNAGANVTFSASATDMVDGTDPVTCSPASDSTFAIGSTKVTCTATDSSGLSASATFTVTVADSTPPTLTVPASITTASTSASGAVVTYAASAVDPVDGSVTPVCTPASGRTFAIGTSILTCTATDSASNKASATFTVTVVPNLGSFAVYATEAVELSSGSSVTGCNVGVENTGGPFLAGGAAAYFSSGAKVQSSQTLFASSVYLSSGASLGPLYTNKVIASSGATHGKVSTFPAMPAPPAAPSATAGAAAVTVSAGASKTLASGAYGNVTVSSGATLKLTGGTYVFASLTLSSAATLAVSAPTALSVTGAASFSSSSSLGPASGSGLTAKALTVYFDGSSGINVSSGAKVRALFVAPRALVTVSTSSFTGAIAAAQVLMNAGATVACEDGLGSM